MANGGVVQGELLRRARQAKGLTQAKLAEQIAELAWLRDRQHLGIGPDMVSKWERDIKHPNPTYGGLLCVFFGSDPATLGLRRMLGRWLAAAPRPPLMVTFRGPKYWSRSESTATFCTGT